MSVFLVGLVRIGLAFPPLQICVFLSEPSKPSLLSCICYLLQSVALFFSPIDFLFMHTVGLQCSPFLYLSRVVSIYNRSDYWRAVSKCTHLAFVNQFECKSLTPTKPCMSTYVLLCGKLSVVHITRGG